MQSDLVLVVGSQPSSYQPCWTCACDGTNRRVVHQRSSLGLRPFTAHSLVPRLQRMLVSTDICRELSSLPLLLQSILRSTTTRRIASMSTSAPKVAVHNHETYLSQGIKDASELDPNPLEQFTKWFTHAQEDPSVIEPEAMALSTVNQDGVPSTRFVLMKRVDTTGVQLFTNYESRKGKELFGENGDQNRCASVAFYWRPLHLSVRFVGRAEKVEKEITAEYHSSRPVGSRVGAWASKQSSALPGGREELDECVKKIEAKFGVKDGSAKASAVDVGPDGKEAGGEGDVDIPVPPFWGGVRIVPFEVEFWAGRESRLHDRFRYTRPEGSDGEWEIVRLAP